jgi:hypothetical protein
MKLNPFDAWVVTKYESQDTTFLKDPAMMERNIRVWTRRPEDACLFRKPSVADGLVRDLKRVWLGCKLGVEKVHRLEAR